MKRPIKYKTDGGSVFDVRVKKVNIRSYWLELMGTGHIIKVKKASKKLIWEV